MSEYDPLLLHPRIILSLGEPLGEDPTHPATQVSGLETRVWGNQKYVTVLVPRGGLEPKKLHVSGSSKHGFGSSSLSLSVRCNREHWVDLGF